MRLEKDIKYDGIFWLPESPEHVVSGTLHIKNDGEIEIIINDNKNIKNIELHIYLDFIFNFNNLIINGKIHNDKLVTLLD